MGSSELVPVGRTPAAHSASTPCHVPGVVLVEDGAALVVGIPRESAVSARLAEDNGVARFGVYLGHVFLILFPSEHLGRTGNVRLVAAGNDADAAVAGPFISEQVFDDAEAGENLTLAVEIGGVVKVAVQHAAGTSLVHRDQTGTVVEPPAFPEDGVEVRDGFGMRQHFSEGVAQRPRQFQ